MSVPFMRSFDDAVALSQQMRDNFYVNAFRIECRLGKLANDVAKEYAEKRHAVIEGCKSAPAESTQSNRIKVHEPFSQQTWTVSMLNPLRGRNVACAWNPSGS